MRAYPFLTEEGKYDRAAIMRHAHLMMFRFSSFSESLKYVWGLAKRNKRDYNKASALLQEDVPFAKKNCNILKESFLINHPENRYYDNSWR